MMNFTPFVNDIKDSFTKEQLKTFEQIKDYKNVQLASMAICCAATKSCTVNAAIPFEYL